MSDKPGMEKLRSWNGGELRLMEVCGTHTVQMYRTGLRQVLPESIHVISGPGCPVCVTPAGYIDAAAAIARQYGPTLLTFGDMVRVPGLQDSLEGARADGAKVQVVLSPLDAVNIAADHPETRYVFLAVGFETTAPATALAIKHAADRNLCNLHFLSAHKTMPAAMEYLSQPGCLVDAFLYPGHVAAITGLAPFRALLKSGASGAVAGFEAEDLLRALLAILRGKESGQPFCVNAYEKVVHEEGNRKAQGLVDRVFQPCDAIWRGLGLLPGSGLQLKPEFAHLDAWTAYPVEVAEGERPGCRCADVLTGEIEPRQCPLFGKACTPRNPVGACMVSSEGSCAAAYRFGTGELI